MSSSQPARLSFSLRALAARGSMSRSTHDGWGVAFYQDRDVALFREPAAAADSALVQFLQTQGPATDLAISHIRHATRGAVSLANTQPFVRELGRRRHVFAHNGDLPGIFDHPALAGGCFRPVGSTDSEHAFCALLSRMGALWQGAARPPLDARLAVLGRFAAELRALGPANFLYADADALFAHGHRRQQPGGGRAEPPGLWCLTQECAAMPAKDHELAGVSVGRAAQSVLLLASVPLSGAAWRPLGEDELLVVRSGRIESSVPP